MGGGEEEPPSLVAVLCGREEEEEGKRDGAEEGQDRDAQLSEFFRRGLGW